ncbi:MAG: GTPase ObgE [Deltaproteobacteria bacterium CG11_big_fil_rev_8_21_14_0_20_49_13]|nr:MAG: GTPase ObgE [Deltaproteobacteria bacterium CG11_big_fil_rev_8_21_14_0_20_49_13]
MKFIDETELEVFAGDGGRGCVSFRREKYVPKGGPDGGDGAKGGNVIFKADGGLTTLLDVKLRKHIRAPNGGHGMGSQMNGRSGKDAILSVPIGTIVKDIGTGEVIADITKHDEEVVVARGGRGGLGNMNFKTSVNQAPRKAQPGEKGEVKRLSLELKLLADVGLVGFPNAGKSTLISAVSNARPKIADYPFTTKTPYLGVVRHKGKSFTVADIPGLIEGAHKGMGLGIRFLKHVERTRLIVHLIDVTNPEVPDPMEAYKIIRHELKNYSEGLEKTREIIAVTKIDIPEVLPLADKFKKEISKKGKNVVEISAVAHKHLDKLLDMIIHSLNEVSK